MELQEVVCAVAGVRVLGLEVERGEEYSHALVVVARVNQPAVVRRAVNQRTRDRVNQPAVVRLAVKDQRTRDRINSQHPTILASLKWSQIHVFTEK